MRWLALGLVVATACAAPARAPRAAVVTHPSARAWVYEVAVASDARDIDVEAVFPPTGTAEFEVADGAEEFVRDLVVQGDPRVVTARGGCFDMPSCGAVGCRVRYRFALAKAAARLRDPRVADAYDDAFVAPTSTWLLRPAHVPHGLRYRFRVTTPPGVAFVTGVHRAGPAHPDGTYEADARTIRAAPFAALGALAVERMTVPGATIEVAVLPARFRMRDAEIGAWTAESARAVADYLGGFPMSRALVVIAPADGKHTSGVTLGGAGGASVLMTLGRGVRVEDARRDWVLTHELLHLAFPTLGPEHAWMEEGLATYLEPVVRARGRTLSVAAFWKDLAEGLPNGLPREGDRGLLHTRAWGRTYWGGALYWLLADLEIRTRTGGARSLDDVLRAIAAAGGNAETRWDVERVLRAGDDATGVPVLRELYVRMGRAPGAVDLATLWSRLGVSLQDGEVAFDDRAELAEARRGITGP